MGIDLKELKFPVLLAVLGTGLMIVGATKQLAIAGVSIAVSGEIFRIVLFVSGALLLCTAPMLHFLEARRRDPVQTGALLSQAVTQPETPAASHASAVIPTADVSGEAATHPEMPAASQASAPATTAYVSGEVERRLSEILIGRWYGTTTETENSRGEKKTYNVTWHFRIEDGNLVCDSSAERSDGGKIEIDDYRLKIRSLENRFMLIDFFNVSKKMVLNFGSEVLQISDDNEHFWGRFVSYSPRSKEIIAGTIEGRRRADN